MACIRLKAALSDKRGSCTMEEFELENAVAGTQIELLLSFCRSFAYRKCIKDYVNHTSPGTNFWIHTSNLCVHNCAIEWCKIFGAYNNESHWTKAFENSPEITSEIRVSVVAAVSRHDKEWESYQNEVKTFRDTYSAHRNTNITAPVPFLDCAFDIAAIYYSYVVSSIRNPIQTDLNVLYSDFYDEAQYFLQKSGFKRNNT